VEEKKNHAEQALPRRKIKIGAKQLEMKSRGWGRQKGHFAEKI